MPVSCRNCTPSWRPARTDKGRVDGHHGPERHPRPGITAWCRRPRPACTGCPGHGADHDLFTLRHFAIRILMSVCALLMAWAPHTLTIYYVFVLGYGFVGGLCFASFTAVTLETIGTDAAATKYSIFASLSNTPIAYMGILNSYFFDKAGGNAGLYSDAAMGVVGVQMFLLVAVVSKAIHRRAKRLSIGYAPTRSVRPSIAAEIGAAARASCCQMPRNRRGPLPQSLRGRLLDRGSEGGIQALPRFRNSRAVDFRIVLIHVRPSNARLSCAVELDQPLQRHFRTGHCCFDSVGTRNAEVQA